MYLFLLIATCIYSVSTQPDFEPSEPWWGGFGGPRPFGPHRHHPPFGPRGPRPPWQRGPWGRGGGGGGPFNGDGPPPRGRGFFGGGPFGPDDGPPMEPFGGGPHRHHHRHGPWGGGPFDGPSIDDDGPMPPPPINNPDDDFPPPQPPAQFQPPQSPQQPFIQAPPRQPPQPPSPPPLPPRVFPPVLPQMPQQFQRPPAMATTQFRYSPEIQRLISTINARTSAFRWPGQNYENVITVMRRYFGRRANMVYDPSRISIPRTSLRNELSVNSRVAPALFEADIVMTVGQINRVEQFGRSKRKVNSNTTTRWPGAYIPYRFSETDASWQSVIRSAIAFITQNTCVRFGENAAGTDYVLFTRGVGCYSSVGRLGGAQEVSIGYGCETLGIISHEILHTTGFWHEQSRPERDSFVSIHRENVVRGTEAQFDKRSTSESIDYGVEYDYGSVMHYASNAFSRGDGLQTVQPLEPSYKYTIGSRVEPSFLDLKALNLAYCSNRCSNSIGCLDGGYVHPNDCNRCICPTGLEGTRCERLRTSNCGVELPMASSQYRSVSYFGASTCYWRIKANPGQRIRFELTHVYFKCAPTCEEFVEIKYDISHEKTGFRLCCKTDFGELVSKGSSIIIISRATANSQFTLKYRAEGSASPSQVALPLTAPRGPPGTSGATQQQTVRRAPTGTGSWSQWSGWTGCTELCGACGTRYRERTCYSGNCSGGNRQTQVCNQQACSPGTTLNRGKRSLRRTFHHYVNTRTRRALNWCCSKFQLVNGNWCNPLR